jgi:pimeloyl-ACP methyl ester carboxylesterase
MSVEPRPAAKVRMWPLKRMAKLTIGSSATVAVFPKRSLASSRRGSRRRSRAGALVAGSGSCLDDSALNAVPLDGGVDLYLRWEANPPYPGFIDCFANGVGLEDARILAAAQRPAALAQFSEPSGPPAWKTIPSWSLIGTLDHVIPRALQEEMSSRAGAHISRVRAGHLTPITRPADVTKVILSAVDATA